MPTWRRGGSVGGARCVRVLPARSMDLRPHCDNHGDRRTTAHSRRNTGEATRLWPQGVCRPEEVCGLRAIRGSSGELESGM